MMNNGVYFIPYHGDMMQMCLSPPFLPFNAEAILWYVLQLSSCNGISYT